MPHFTLDLVWTDKGREDFHSGRFLRTRNIAIDIARQNNLNIVSITDRLAPTPVGPVWVVEGQEKLPLWQKFSGGERTETLFLNQAFDDYDCIPTADPTTVETPKMPAPAAVPVPQTPVVK